MSHLHRLLCAAAASLAILITASTAIAQEASGTPASPGAPSAPAAAADITVGGVEYAFTGCRRASQREPPSPSTT